MTDKKVVFQICESYDLNIFGEVKKFTKMSEWNGLTELRAQDGEMLVVFLDRPSMLDFVLKDPSVKPERVGRIVLGSPDILGQLAGCQDTEG